MAFSETEKQQIRYYCGYGTLGQQALPANGYRFFTEYGEMEYKLINLQIIEEDEVRDYYLVELATLKSDIPAVRQNLDTKQAAVWTWNDKEFKDRRKLFDYIRLELCNYLGLTPGPGLLRGGMSLAV